MMRKLMQFVAHEVAQEGVEEGVELCTMERARGKTCHEEGVLVQEVAQEVA